MPVSSQHIRNVLRDTRIADHPGRQALQGLPADLVSAWFKLPLREAAVLVPLMNRPDGLTVLLTRRTDNVRDHAGQISFPGGSREADDVTLESTALRESQEEIGLKPDAVTVIGYLDAHPVITGFAVLPVVGMVESPPKLVAHPGEVADIFEVPLSVLLQPGNGKVHTRVRNGVGLPTHEYVYNDWRIWGATAQILNTLITKIS